MNKHRPVRARALVATAGVACILVVVALALVTNVRRAEASALIWPHYSIGATGENVRTIQYLLQNAGYTLATDGTFGPITQAKVRDFQRVAGLSVTGTVNNQTWEELVVLLQQGATGPAVVALQRQLNHVDGAGLDPDGVFGPLTDAAVRHFQQVIEGEIPTGRVVTLTWNDLVTLTGL